MIYDIDGNTISGSSSASDEVSMTSGLLRLFRSIGVIGDSIASGTICFANSDGSDVTEDVRYEWSWMEIICRRYNIEGTNFSRGGAAATTWASTFSKSWPDSTAKNAYLIALGTNDIGDTMGDWDSTDTTTFGGAYNNIIYMIKQKNENAAIFCLTPYGYPSTEAMTEIYRIIRQICKNDDNCFFVDISGALEDPSDYKYKYWYNGHPNTIGNLCLANIIEDKIDDVIKSNWGFFAKFAALQEGTDTNPLVGY